MPRDNPQAKASTYDMNEADNPMSHAEAVMDQDHAFASEHLPAYALDALEGEEKARVARHVNVCSLCQKEYDVYQDVASSLAFAVPVYDPPSYLRTAIRTQIATSPAGASLERGESPRRRRARPVAMWLNGIVLIALVVVASWNVRLQQEVQNMHGNVERTFEVLNLFMHYQAEPDKVHMRKVVARRSDSNTWGLVMQEEDSGRLIIYMDGLPVLPAGRVYQLWLRQETWSRLNDVAFRCDGKGRALLEMPLPVSLYVISAVGLTAEPESAPANVECCTIVMELEGH